MCGNVKQYDLICSLGGNCAAAHNLLHCGLRKFSLPFDWLYILDDGPIYRLSECFENDFKNFCLKENMKPLPEGVNRSHLDREQYYDTYTGYRFVNHFSKKIEDGGFPEVKKKITRRISRLLSYIEQGKDILFILATSFEFDLDSVIKLSQTLQEKWPDKNFSFEVLMFCSASDSMTTTGNITLRKYTRSMNNCDFCGFNNEWCFLYDLSLKPVLHDIHYSLWQKICYKVFPITHITQNMQL